MTKNPGITQSKARVLVVDDHPLVRQGLVQVINQQNDLVVSGEAVSHAEVLTALSARSLFLCVRHGSSVVEVMYALDDKRECKA